MSNMRNEKIKVEKLKDENNERYKDKKLKKNLKRRRRINNNDKKWWKGKLHQIQLYINAIDVEKY